jgi:methionyl-tRNA formyltransferase
MVQELDAGPIYLKRPLSLEGSAQEIFERSAEIVFDMIYEIITKDLVASPQVGQPVSFARRTPEQSRIEGQTSPEALYDHIRMLDADTYPPAFVDSGDWRIEFRQAKLINNSVEARVFIRRRSEKV